MTAQGKVNASKVQVNDRILVSARVGVTLAPSLTKTGEQVRIARVLTKSFVPAGRNQVRGTYTLHTSAGDVVGLVPIQTMWLAPEDAAGIKRAHAEAEAEDTIRTANASMDPEDYWGQDVDDLVEVTNVGGQLAGTAQIDSVSADGTMTGRMVSLAPVDVASNVARIEKQFGIKLVRNEDAPAPVDSVATPVLEATGSAVVRLLERVHERIRQNHPEVPQAVIVTGAGTSPAAGSKWGHFRAKGWTAKGVNEGPDTHVDEMFMAGETLAKGARQVLQTMLHESAHALAAKRGEQDTSRQGRWHNKVFMKTAAEMGLEHKGSVADKQHGYSFVTLTDETVAEYADLTAELDREIHLMVKLPFWLGGDKDEDGGGEQIGKKPKGAPQVNGGNVKATCECEEPNIVRMSRKVLDLAVVNCGDCDSLFQARD